MIRACGMYSSQDWKTLLGVTNISGRRIELQKKAQHRTRRRPFGIPVPYCRGQELGLCVLPCFFSETGDSKSDVFLCQTETSYHFGPFLHMYCITMTIWQEEAPHLEYVLSTVFCCQVSEPSQSRRQRYDPCHLSKSEENLLDMSY